MIKPTIKPSVSDFEMEEAEKAFNSKNFIQAYALYERLAANGNPEAQLLVGWMNEVGCGTDVSVVQAKKWYLLSTESNPVLGWLYLARLQENIGEVRDANTSYQNAANVGSLIASYRLGLNYKIFQTDPLFWLKRAADQGHVFSIMQIGRMILRGELHGNKLRGLIFMARAYLLAVKYVWQGGSEALTNDERLQQR